MNNGSVTPNADDNAVGRYDNTIEVLQNFAVHQLEWSHVVHADPSSAYIS